MAMKKPFSLVSKHAVASENLDKIIGETNAQTKRGYHGRFVSMYQTKLQSISNNDEGMKDDDFNPTPYQVFTAIADEIEDKRNKGLLKHSSLRQYKSAINYGLTYTAAAKDKDKVSKIPPAQSAFYKDLSAQMNMAQINAISARVLDWGSENAKETKALDKKADKKNQTSSKKMKGFPEVLYNLVMEDDFHGRFWLREFIYFNVRFGLRPKEWQHAVVLNKKDFHRRFCTDPNYSISEKALKIGAGVLSKDNMLTATDDSHKLLPYVMVVKNAKATHGRACGEHRFIHFDASDRDFKRLNELIDHLHERAARSKTAIPAGVEDTFELTVFRAMQQQLYAFFKKFKPNRLLRELYQKQLDKYHKYVEKEVVHGRKVKISPPLLKTPTLYSTRHQAIANAKADGFTSLQVAALFGHVSVHTASAHYAHKSVGNKGSTKMAPSPENIEYILMSLTDMPVHAAEKTYNKVNDHQLDLDEVLAFGESENSENEVGGLVVDKTPSVDTGGDKDKTPDIEPSDERKDSSPDVSDDFNPF